MRFAREIMARWSPNPNDPIGGSEILGRRLSDEPLLVGARNQRPFNGLDLRNFQEKRGREYSLDRMGKTGIQRQVLNYLIPLAKIHANSFDPAKTFVGWATIQAKKLANPPKGGRIDLFPSPKNDPGVPENIYHAHALRPEGDNEYLYALHLKELFTYYGNVRPIIKIDELTPNWLPGYIKKCLNYILIGLPNPWLVRIINKSRK